MDGIQSHRVSRGVYSVRPKIKKHYRGLVPMYIPHPESLCAFYHCKRERQEDRRWCREHTAQYKSEVDDQGGADIVPFKLY